MLKKHRQVLIRLFILGFGAIGLSSTLFGCHNTNLSHSTGTVSAYKPGHSQKRGFKAGPAIDFLFDYQSQAHRISQYRGKPLVIILIRTSEVTSEMYLLEVLKIYEQSKQQANFLALTIEPQEAPFVDLYAEFHKLPFPLGVAEPKVAIGESPLGLIPIVPTTYILDAQGSVHSRFAGVTTAQNLRKSIKKAAR